jgi:hypothetical protein
MSAHYVIGTHEPPQPRIDRRKLARVATLVLFDRRIAGFMLARSSQGYVLQLWGIGVKPLSIHIGRIVAWVEWRTRWCYSPTAASAKECKW